MPFPVQEYNTNETAVQAAIQLLDYFGQPLDLNANMLVEFDNGAMSTVFWANARSAVLQFGQSASKRRICSLATWILDGGMMSGERGSGGALPAVQSEASMEPDMSSRMAMLVTVGRGMRDV